MILQNYFQLWVVEVMQLPLFTLAVPIKKMMILICSSAPQFQVGFWTQWTIDISLHHTPLLDIFIYKPTTELGHWFCRIQPQPQATCSTEANCFSATDIARMWRIKHWSCHESCQQRELLTLAPLSSGPVERPDPSRSEPWFLLTILLLLSTIGHSPCSGSRLTILPLAPWNL